MSGNWIQKWKDGKVAFQNRGCEHVEIIAEIVTVVRIPTDVAIRLMVDMFVQELGLEDLKETFSRSEIQRRLEFKSGQQVIDGQLFQRDPLFAFLRGLLGF